MSLKAKLNISIKLSNSYAKNDKIFVYVDKKKAFELKFSSIVNKYKNQIKPDQSFNPGPTNFHKIRC